MLHCFKNNSIHIFIITIFSISTALCSDYDLLISAVEQDNLNECKQYLEALSKAPEKGETALHLAAKKGYCTILELLLSSPHTPLNRIDNFNGSALHCAIKYRKIDCIKILIKAKADLNVQIPGIGLTPLHVAAWLEHLEIAQLLLDAGACVKIMTPEKLTAEGYAKKHNKTKFLEFLKTYQKNAQ